MPRGKKPKVQATKTEVDLKILEVARIKEIEALYIDLAKVKQNVDEALTRIGFMDEVDSVAAAAFKAGRTYTFLDKANDKLEEILDNLYDSYDLENWSDITNN
jgi:methylphosphotriester-DNA--protein-cysteine methyltransferase